MADPVTAGLFISGGTQLLGGITQASGARQEGKAAQAAAEFNAQISEAQGKQKESLIRRRGRRQLGRMRASIGKAGVTIEGSPMEAMADQAAEQEIDALNARFDAMANARLQRMGGQAAAKRGKRESAAALLGTVTNIGSSFFSGGIGA